MMVLTLWCFRQMPLQLLNMMHLAMQSRNRGANEGVADRLVTISTSSAEFFSASCKCPSSALARNGSFACAAEGRWGHQQSLAKKGRGELNISGVLRDAGGQRDMMKRSLQNAFGKEWATRCVYDAISVISAAASKRLPDRAQITSRAF